MIQLPSHANFRIVSAPQKESSYPVAVTLIPHSRETTNLLSVSMFALLDVLCKCYHTIVFSCWPLSGAQHFRGSSFLWTNNTCLCGRSPTLTLPQLTDATSVASLWVLGRDAAVSSLWRDSCGRVLTSLDFLSLGDCALTFWELLLLQLLNSRTTDGAFPLVSSLHLPVSLSVYLPFSLSVFLSLFLSLCLPVSHPLDTQPLQPESLSAHQKAGARPSSSAAQSLQAHRSTSVN